VHRTSAGGAANLQQIQRNLYETLRRVRPKVVQDLSPRWQGQALSSRVGKVRVPIWAVAAVVGVVLFAFFITLRSMLGYAADASSDLFSGLHPDGDIKIARMVIAPPPPPPPPPVPDQLTQLQRIRAALATEISAHQLTADQNAKTIFIRVGDLVMFEPGQDAVRPQFNPIAAKIAAALEKEPGQIKVTGHTDKTPIHTVRFPSNWDLSLARAKAVTELLKPRLSNPERLEVEGKGSDVPIASNSTPEGRARNRRVEVTIPRAD
jgi:type VI secretion system protein ImpK